MLLDNLPLQGYASTLCFFLISDNENLTVNQSKTFNRVSQKHI